MDVLAHVSLLLCVAFPYITAFRFNFLFHEVFSTKKRMCYQKLDRIIVQIKSLNCFLSVSDAYQSEEKNEQLAKGVAALLVPADGGEPPPARSGAG